MYDYVLLCCVFWQMAEDSESHKYERARQLLQQLVKWKQCNAR